MKNMYTKGEVIDYIWQYSRYYGNLLGYCDEIANDGNGHAALIYLFNITEIVFKSKTKNYNAGFKSVIKTLKKQNYINDIEQDFLNNEEKGIRRIRNLLAHENLSKYNIIFLGEDKSQLYPLTENETCIKLYNLFSDILFNLMLKIINTDLLTSTSIDLNEVINSIDIEIKEISAEKVLEYRGIDYREITKWGDLTEIDKYRIAENSQDVNVLSEIFKNLFTPK